MTPHRHALAAVLATGALVALLAPLVPTGPASAQGETPSLSATVTVTETVTATPTPTSSPTPSPSPAPEPDGVFDVDDAQLRWGVNDESNNKAFAPGTYNFLSAGRVPDPGKGGQRIDGTGSWTSTGAQAWFARRGDVRIEKRRPDGTYGGATFAGLFTAVDGSPLTSTTGPFSGHQVVLDGGDGRVDTDAGTATIRWKGSFSVVYYSGMTFFTVSDPVLSVRPSGATLTATLGGYASSMDDQTVWVEVPDRKGVVLADLPKVDLAAALGFSAAPRYLGVRHTAPASGTQQVTSGPSWGAFPRSFLAFMGTVGSSSYWYSSGGSADAHKVPQPLTVSYEAGRPVTPPPVDDSGDDGGDGGHGNGGADDDPSGEPSTTVNPAPPATQPPGPSLPAQAPGSTTPTGAAPAAGPGAAPVPGPPATPATTYALTSSATASEGPNSASDRPSWPWWLGSALLLAAAALSLIARTTRSTPSTKGSP